MDGSRCEGIQERTRVRLHVIGTVQGVGFRPFAYRLAERIGVSGSVRNITGEVVIEAEGTMEQIRAFQFHLRHDAKPPIRIERIEETSLPPRHDDSFLIETSTQHGLAAAGFPADLAACMECVRDIQNPQSKYYRYPFTSCTSCGPRYTVVRALPYDRSRTAFASFPLCDACRSEYEDSTNRRFHAQTMTCPECGPAVECRSPDGVRLPGDALQACLLALREGGIAAVKGVGGFHLICDAVQEQAVLRLRARKHRPRKPFALMAKDINHIEDLFVINAAEREALLAPEAPIVLVTPKEKALKVLPLAAIAPGLTRIGVFLPYTPLHHLLLSQSPGWFVATSGNASGHPMTYKNEEAYSRLQGIADVFLLHKRDIVVPIDDSVGHVVEQQFRLIRRARGYVPVPLPVPLPTEFQDLRHPAVLGVGAEMKSSVCLIHHGVAFLSQHLGEMNTMESLAIHRQVREHLAQLFGIDPTVTAYDPHPNYAISRETLKSNDPNQIPVLHHHAHMAACMAENRLDCPVIGCVLDGSGYGSDGTLWGFEVLTGDYVGFTRLRSIRPFLLPGGEAAIRNPWMIGAALLYEATKNLALVQRLIVETFPRHRERLPILSAQLTGKLPSMRASSAGRLFDGVSAILGLCAESTYEGEAALQLSDLVDPFAEQAGNDMNVIGAYPFDIIDERWDVSPAIRALLNDLDNCSPLPLVGRRFHLTVAAMVAEGVRAASGQTGIRQVVLSGGVWNNRYLVRAVKSLLTREGFAVYTHRIVPSGDGGISFGQAVCGLWRWAREHVLIGTNESDRGL